MEVTLNDETRDVNVKDGKLSEEKLNAAARAKLFPHVWVEQEAFDEMTEFIEGMTYIIYEETSE